ncbi:isocitrate lyase [Microdochium nivale]|nr:isocitrate lyase [Microdochium nivale]
MRVPKAEREHLECVNYLAPIVADADMGFGTLTGCMKLARSFVEAGVAMVDIDDIALGLKKFTNGKGRTIVPTLICIDSLSVVPPHSSNISWSYSFLKDAAGLGKVVPNTLGVGKHQLLTCSSFTHQGNAAGDASAWSADLFDRLNTSGDAAVLGGRYLASRPPGDKTSKQTYGEKWELDEAWLEHGPARMSLTQVEP